MTSGMPELGSKISLISKADIRYEGRLFTVDPQECTIALASVRSFGTEDRETQYPVAPQSQVYDYILFRGSDIKDIRVLNNVPSLPNDPAIMQMSVPPTLGAGGAPSQFVGQFTHPVVGQQQQFPQYHHMAGFPGSVHGAINKNSELSSQGELTSVLQPITAPIGVQVPRHSAQVKDQGSMLDLIGGGSQQNTSRSTTPALSTHRKSPTTDQGTQVNSNAGGGRGDTRRGSNSNKQQPHNQQPHNQQPHNQQPHNQQLHNQHQHNQHQHNQHQHNQHQQQQHQSNQRVPNSHNRQRYPSQGASGQGQGVGPVQHNTQPQHHNTPAQYNHHQQGQGFNRGGWRGRSRGRGRGFMPRNSKNTLKFDNDYDFEQANTEFEELRTQLVKTKISDGEANTKIELLQDQVDKKEDSGNETGAGEAEAEDDSGYTYDKAKSFFDNISCEAVERSKGRSQRTDWRTERKLNSETFGVASARRGAWRGRGGWRHNAPHHAWRPNMRGGRGRPNNTLTPVQQPPATRPQRNATAPQSTPSN